MISPDLPGGPDAAQEASAQKAAAPVDLPQITPPSAVVPRATAVAVAVAAGLMFALLTIWIARRGPSVPAVDEHIHRWVVSHRSRGGVRIARGVTWGGVTRVVLPALIAVGALATRGGRDTNRRLAAGLLLSCVASLGVYAEIRINALVGRGRPPVADWAAWPAARRFPRSTPRPPRCSPCPAPGRSPPGSRRAGRAARSGRRRRLRGRGGLVTGVAGRALAHRRHRRLAFRPGLVGRQYRGDPHAAPALRQPPGRAIARLILPPASGGRPASQAAAQAVPRGPPVRVINDPVQGSCPQPLPGCRAAGPVRHDSPWRSRSVAAAVVPRGEPRGLLPERRERICRVQEVGHVIVMPVEVLAPQPQPQVPRECPRAVSEAGGVAGLAGIGLRVEHG